MTLQHTRRAIARVLLRLFGACGLLAWALVFQLHARDLAPAERLSDFDQLVTILRTSYGMIDYKKQVLDIDLDARAATYRARVEAVASDDAFYDLLSAFLAEFRDSHLGQYRPSTMSAKLGFVASRVEGKAVITDIDRALLPPDRFPFKVGDELVSLDGRPVRTILREMLPYHWYGREESGLGLLTRLLTSRSGWRVSVPRGSCRVAVLALGSGEARVVEIPWNVKGQPLPGLSFYVAGNDREPQYPLPPGQFLPEVRVNVLAASLPPETAPSTPPEGSRPGRFFDSCTIESPGGPLGYIRIPTFGPRNAREARDEFRALLESMASTKGLVLDITNNPGGMLPFCFSLAAMLTDRPLSLTLEAERANRRTLVRCREKIQKTTDAEQLALLTRHAGDIERAMDEGLLVTPFTALWAPPVQPPDPTTRYTAPLLVLINDQCYSCGDVFPAILKDNGRAALFGTTTGGAGGAVSTYGPLSYCGSSIHVTDTISRRPNGSIIENLGVSPDVPYELTQADIADGGRAYRKAYVEALLGLLPRQ